MLATTICPLTGVGVAIAFGSTRYFTAMQNVGQVKSSVDDLTMERGTVSMRVAFVLRSAEVQPLFRDLCDGALVCVCVCDITLTHLARGQFYPPPPHVNQPPNTCVTPTTCCGPQNTQHKQHRHCAGWFLPPWYIQVTKNNTTQHNNQPKNQKSFMTITQ
jgi:hypothetical protein